MRFLYLNPQGTFYLTDDLNENDSNDDNLHDDDSNNDGSPVIPRYAILSHTWGGDKDEMIFDDIQNRAARDKTGYKKLEFCTERANKDGIDYFWIDTCCINKANYAELSEVITSMFRWHQNEAKCYVFSTGVLSSKQDAGGKINLTWRKSFQSRRWFTRGWALQEPLAAQIVEFFSREGVLLGRKDTRLWQIHVIASQGSA